MEACLINETGGKICWQNERLHRSQVPVCSRFSDREASRLFETLRMSIGRGGGAGPLIGRASGFFFLSTFWHVRDFRKCGDLPKSRESKSSGPGRPASSIAKSVSARHALTGDPLRNG